jgi:hypothetical protein
MSVLAAQNGSPRRATQRGRDQGVPEGRPSGAHAESRVDRSKTFLFKSSATMRITLGLPLEASGGVAVPAPVSSRSRPQAANSRSAARIKTVADSALRGASPRLRESTLNTRQA